MTAPDEALPRNAEAERRIARDYIRVRVELANALDALDRIDDLAAFLRAAWNSAHAQREAATDYSLKRVYDGRIAALESVADRFGISLTEDRS